MDELSRRDVLFLVGGAIVALAAPGLLYKSTRTLILDFVADTASSEPEFQPIANPDNIPESNHCFVIVHPGYGLYREAAYAEDKGYPKYLENLHKLMIHLEKKDEISLFAIEHSLYLNQSYLPGFGPLRNSLLYITLDKMGFSQRRVLTPEGFREQNIDTLLDLLDSKGVKEMWFAGEHTDRCVKRAAWAFHPQFRIRGIEDCLFPSQRKHNFGGLTDDLYNDQVSLNLV